MNRTIIAIFLFSLFTSVAAAAGQKQAYVGNFLKNFTVDCDGPGQASCEDICQAAADLGYPCKIINGTAVITVSDEESIDADYGFSTEYEGESETAFDEYDYESVRGE